MQSLFRFVASPSPCGYLPDQRWSLEYEFVRAMTAGEYQQRLVEGWRHFGGMLFRPACPTCRACQSIRVAADRFRPDRSQRRARKANEGRVRLEVGKPIASRANLDLYDRFHAFHADFKGWPQHPAKDAESYAESFADNPFAVEEWRYFVGDRLIGVGYVDALPGGLSAIYFIYDPDERDHSPGTWNVLCLIDEARRRGLPHVYLGYHVRGCGSMEYKARYHPCEVLAPDGAWIRFRPGD